MNTLRAASAAVLAVALALIGAPARSWAATNTVGATVSATVDTVATIAAARDSNSVTRFSATQVVFDRLDLSDPGVTGPNANFMYAPYRSEVGKNWHVLNLVANGTTTSLSADVGGSILTVQASTLMDVFFGGFFRETGGSGLQPSSNWELLDTFSRTLDGAFSGVSSFNYRLRVAGVPASTTPYTGISVTYTFTSN